MLLIKTRKQFLELLGNDGLNKLLHSYTDKTAEAVCTFAFTTGPSIDPITFQGRLEVCSESP
jgi:inosine triphosphate pyrophosphatase